MKLTAQIERIRHFLVSGIDFDDVNLEVELTTDENENLQNLLSHNGINEKSYLAEFAWYFAKAKELLNQENQIQAELDTIRERIYLHPQRFYDLGKQKGITQKEAEELWNEEQTAEREILETDKQKRDRELFKDLETLSKILSKNGYPSKVQFKFISEENNKLQDEICTINSEFLNYLMTETLKRVQPDDVLEVINIIGENHNSKTPKKLNREIFATKLNDFINYHFKPQITEYKRLQVIAGIMYFAGLERPTNQKNPLKYEIGSNNEEYRKYVLNTLLHNFS